jgi:hypothetical protein
MKLKLQVLPMDDVDIDALLKEIMDQGRVTRVIAGDGRTYLHVTRFEDHQKIDPRWKTRCPACAQLDSLIPAETPLSSPEPQRDSPKLPLGRDGKGWEGKKTSSKPAASKEFDSFWASYPRKIGKEAAKKAFTKALTKTTAEKIMSGVEDLRIQVAGKDPQFTPHAATWLNAGRWDDEVAKPQLAIVPNGYAWANR